eukprot:scaffold306457_cov28-Tisochrysis_lutea.AAC.1
MLMFAAAERMKNKANARTRGGATSPRMQRARWQAGVDASRRDPACAVSPKCPKTPGRIRCRGSGSAMANPQTHVASSRFWWGPSTERNGVA